MNNVCFPFPFPFFPFGGSFPLPDSGPSLPLLPLDPPACQAGAAGGAGFPNIFLNDTFPLTGALCLFELAVGNSGNRAFDNFGGGGPGRVRDDDESGREMGGLGPEGAREVLEDQGVFRGPWRNAGG